MSQGQAQGVQPQAQAPQVGAAQPAHWDQEEATHSWITATHHISRHITRRSPR